MAYNSNYPADNAFISQLPKDLRDKGEQLRTERIVDAGKLGGLTANDLDQRPKFDQAAGHRHTGIAGDGPPVAASGLADGAATDAKIGNRTADDTQAPTGNTGTLLQLLSWIVNRIKAILGGASWRDAPPTTLTAAKAHIDSSANPHGVTAAQVGAVPAAGGFLTGDLTVQKNSPRLVADRPTGQTGQYSGVEMRDAGVSKAAVMWDHVNNLLGALLNGTFYELWTRKQWPGRICLVIDDTLVSKAATTWTVVKSFRWGKSSSYGQSGKKLKVIASLWGTNGTKYIQVNIVGTSVAVAPSATYTAEGIVETELDISSLANGLYTIEVSIRHGSSNSTVYQRYLEFNVEY